MNKKILGIGNAIVDVLAKVDDEFLNKNKLIKGSMKLINKTEFEDLKKNIKIEKVEQEVLLQIQWQELLALKEPLHLSEKLTLINLEIYIKKA